MTPVSLDMPAHERNTRPTETERLVKDLTEKTIPTKAQTKRGKVSTHTKTLAKSRKLAKANASNVVVTSVPVDATATAEKLSLAVAIGRLLSPQSFTAPRVPVTGQRKARATKIRPTAEERFSAKVDALVEQANDLGEKIERRSRPTTPAGIQKLMEKMEAAQRELVGAAKSTPRVKRAALWTLFGDPLPTAKVRKPKVEKLTVEQKVERLATAALEAMVAIESKSKAKTEKGKADAKAKAEEAARAVIADGATPRLRKLATITVFGEPPAKVRKPKAVKLTVEDRVNLLIAQVGEIVTAGGNAEQAIAESGRTPRVQRMVRVRLGLIPPAKPKAARKPSLAKVLHDATAEDAKRSEQAIANGIARGKQAKAEFARRSAASKKAAATRAARKLEEQMRSAEAQANQV